MAKLEKNISKFIFYDIVISTIALIIFTIVIFSKNKISKEELFSTQFLFILFYFAVLIFIMLLLVYISFQLKKSDSLTEEEKIKGVGKVIKRKIMIFSWLIFVMILALLYFLRGFNIGIITAIIITTFILLGIAHGVRYLVRRYSGSAEENKPLRFSLSIIIFIIAVVLSPLIASYSIHFVGFQLFNDPVNISECFSPFRDEGMRFWCIDRHAKEARSISFCDSVEQKQIENNIDPGTRDVRSYFFSRDECLQRLSEDTGDISICYKISESGNKDYCISKFAVKTLNISLCENLHDEPMNWKSNCILDIAKELKDIKICNLLKRNSFREICISDISK
ncbi:MAG: hypothetical protein V1684_01030 [bacterium]